MATIVVFVWRSSLVDAEEAPIFRNTNNRKDCTPVPPLSLVRHSSPSDLLRYHLSASSKPLEYLGFVDLDFDCLDVLSFFGLGGYWLGSKGSFLSDGRLFRFAILEFHLWNSYTGNSPNARQSCPITARLGGKGGIYCEKDSTTQGGPMMQNTIGIPKRFACR